MRRNYLTVSFFLIISIFLVSCATQKTRPVFNFPDLNPGLQTGDYVQKVDNFMVILDASGSMADKYKGRSKLDVAKGIVSRFNQTIPDLQLQGGLRTFGENIMPFTRKTTLRYGFGEYSKTDFEKSLGCIKRANGKSPLDFAIDAAGKDLESTEGDIAIIVVSDGIEKGNAHMLATRRIKKALGDRLCIYPVLVGENLAGKKVMEDMAEPGQCGFTVNAEEISSGDDMAGFVKKVFLKEAMDADGDGVIDDLDRCPDTLKGVKVDKNGCPGDTDGDGVYDYLDKCPNTPKGVQVDRNGCLPDTDGDGVYDYLDKCPGTLEGITVNEKGCPYDSDGDGVYDYLDKCPGTPEGAKVNHKGCWVLERVQFDTGKSTIKEETFPALDEVVAVLKNNPSLKVEIEGHTDNVGSKSFNQKLSESRARAVMAYLTKKGIETERLSSAGYGLSRPIAPNNTHEGRSRNRRVELTPKP